ncbi:transcriptional regulator, IclR family [Micromonospora rhizosphaerae]|uniref:Glycerol operon regulatory protein n=1 Tax=Micromonospora rhizosphaerae TaxID=568872 RepID=A0A1C6RSJ5_9ACTN|nr:IclR family transcriptional regulator [Micromonospora rhizosphaerae]SCL20128.1 transcriptional regulator, IclR family [Micromonospora rhizosphaerae]
MPDRGDTQPLPPYAIESVDKALRLLLLMRHRGTVRVTDVSDELGVARSTAHRLLMTLAHHGFVAQDTVSRSYRVGRVMVEIGLAAVGELDVRRKARQHMEKLAAELRETVNLLVLEGAEVHFIDGVESDRTLRVTARTGLLVPAHATAGGKALLAELSASELEALYPNGLDRMTERTLTDINLLRDELAEVRRLGYAINRGEREHGVHAVAVCIRDHAGRAVAALATSVPAPRASRLHSFVEPLRRSADAIGRDL